MAAAGTSIAGTPQYVQERVRLVESGCAEWTSTLKDGYGMAVIGYKAHGRPVRRPAHVVVYEWWIGKVPSGLDLDHLCRNRRCINPLHLEPVTRRENVRRGDLPRLMADPSFRPHREPIAVCKNGHSMAGENVGRNEKRRWCRPCKTESARRRRA